jgi:hypothetical protein
MNKIGHGKMKAFLDVTQCTLLYLYARTQTFSENMLLPDFGFVGPCIFTHPNESTNSTAAAVDRILMMGMGMPETC